MATVGSIPETAADYSRLFEIFSRVSAIAVILVYGSGFLIIALHHAKFGIAEFSPLKPKVFAAGILFCLSCLLPVILGFRIFNTVFDESGRFVKTTYVLRFIDFYLIAFLPAQIWTSLFGRSGEPPNTNTLWVLPVWAVIALVSIFVHRTYFHTRPGLNLIVSGVAAIFFMTTQFLFGDKRLSWVLLWFVMVGWATLAARRALQPPRMNFMEVEWEKVVPALLLVPLSLFATEIYGRIQPQYGGGQPVQVTLTLQEPLAFSEGKQAEVLLLDQTDAGFYVLPTGNEKTSFFVRRDLVLTVAYKHEP